MAVFVDTSCYLALLNVRNPHHTFAEAEMNRLLAQGTPIVTTEAVLVEVLTFVSRFGGHSRTVAVALVDDLRSDPAVRVVPSTTPLFEAGLDLYRRRADKTYSMTDCMSMAVCAQEGIAEVLTADRDFEQEGLAILL